MKKAEQDHHEKDQMTERAYEIDREFKRPLKVLYVSKG